MSEQIRRGALVGATRESPKHSFPFDRIHSKVYNSISKPAKPLLCMLNSSGCFFRSGMNQYKVGAARELPNQDTKPNQQFVGATRESPNQSFPIDRTRKKAYINNDRATEPLLSSMLKLGGYFLWGKSR